MRVLWICISNCRRCVTFCNTKITFTVTLLMKDIYVGCIKLMLEYLLHRFAHLLPLNEHADGLQGRKFSGCFCAGSQMALPSWPLPNAIRIQGSWAAPAHYPPPDVFYFSITIAKWQLMSGTMGICLNLWSMKCCLWKYKYHPRAETSPCAFVIQSFFFIWNPAVLLRGILFNIFSFSQRAASKDTLSTQRINLYIQII